MRISFDGTYREIERGLNQPKQPKLGGSNFGSLLASVSPDKTQIVRNISEINTPEPLKSAPRAASDEPRAQPNLKFPELLAPSILPLSTATIGVAAPDEAVSTHSISVKTPTILSARRVPYPDAFAGLSHEQRQAKVQELVRANGLRFGIDPALSMAVVENESAFNAGAVSKDGFFSKGLMQLLDTTGKEQMARNGATEPYRPFDPPSNVELGVGYLRYLHDIFAQGKALPNNSTAVAAANSTSLEKLAVAAYNAGEGRVASAQERAQLAGKNPGLYEDIESYLPESTQEYVKKVISSKQAYEGARIG